MEPIELLREAFGDVRRLSRTSNGWLMSAPHRDDKHPSFTVFRGADGNWIVHDFSENLTMSLSRYLKEYGGMNIYTSTPNGTGKSESNPKKKTEPDPKLVTWIEDTGTHYPGHGFAEAGIGDSRVYGVFKLTQDHPSNKRLLAGSVAIIIRNEAGKITGIKVRSRFSTKGKYTWAESGYGNPEWFSPNAREADTVIVVEGELKAIMTWYAVQQIASEVPAWQNVAVIGVPGLSSYADAMPAFSRYKRLLFVVDPDVMNSLNNKRTWKLQHVWQTLLLNGKTVKVSGWHLFGYKHKVDGKDINDFVAKGYDPADIMKFISEESSRPKLSRDYLMQNLPMVALTDPAAGVLLAHYVAAMSTGQWINGSAILHSLSTGSVMSLVKVQPRVIRNARQQLRELGVLTKQTKAPVPDGFVLNLTRFRQLLVNPPEPGAINKPQPPTSISPKPHPTKYSLYPAEDFFRLYFVPSLAYFSPYRGARYETVLARALKRLGWTQEAIATMMRVDPRTIRNWLRRVEYAVKIDMNKLWVTLRRELARLRHYVVNKLGTWFKHRPIHRPFTSPFLEVTP